jgi:hypothetical protein
MGVFECQNTYNKRRLEGRAHEAVAGPAVYKQAAILSNVSSPGGFKKQQKEDEIQTAR